ncbi:hypothetical protein [Psychrobacillus sp. NPDC096623]|uniref:hypothetical protein n=1 Tax=Psychrobacillus sp. NPDC096623 TaxID=3364492 RepID=UPI00380ACAC0
MKARKLFTVIMICCLFLSTLTFNSNKVLAEEIENTKVKYTPLEVSNSYSKVMVEDLETGEVEYIESVLEEGEFVHYVFNSEGEEKYKVEAVGNEIQLNGEVIATKTSEITEKLKMDTVKPTEYSTQAIKWEYTTTSSGNSSWKYAQATLIAAVIATLLGVPAGYSIVLTIATTFAGLELTTVYWKKSHYIDANRTYSTCKLASNTSFYKYSNYTGFIKSTGLVENSIDPCNQPY